MKSTQIVSNLWPSEISNGHQIGQTIDPHFMIQIVQGRYIPGVYDLAHVAR